MVQPNDCLLMTKIRSSESTTPSASPATLASKPDQARFHQDELAYLRHSSAQEAQQAQFAAAIDDQRQHRSSNSDNGYDDGNNLQCVGNGESAIEDLDGLRAQVAIGEDEHVVSGGGFLDLLFVRHRDRLPGAT